MAAQKPNTCPKIGKDQLSESDDGFSEEAVQKPITGKSGFIEVIPVSRAFDYYGQLSIASANMPTPGKLALWRLQYEELHALMVNTREQFMARSEDLGALELQNQTVEFRRCVAEIKRNLQRYRETIKKLPTAAAFTDETVENKSGNVSQLLAVVPEVIRLETHVARKVEKLRFLLKQPMQ